MNIGFYTSVFSDRPFDEVLDFAEEAEFEAIEIDVNAHIKTPENVAGAIARARDRGLTVASVTLVGNQLDPDAEKRKELRSRTLKFVQALNETSVPIFVIFPGWDTGMSEGDNYKNFAEHANALLASTPAGALALAIENWPGPKNEFIATTPDGWRQLLALVPNGRFGLEFDPSHLIRLGIDPYSAFDGVKERVKILHGKDTSIDPTRLQAVGYHGRGWWRYRLPGSGLLDWPRFLQQASMSGFKGTIAIEHEDSDFGWPGRDLDMRKLGERKAHQFLQGTIDALRAGP